MDGQTLAVAIALSKGSGGGGGGSGGGFLKVGINPETGALDKTWKEIYDALYEGKYVCIVIGDENGALQTSVTSAYIAGTDYTVETITDSYLTDSENGYPVGGGSPK